MTESLDITSSSQTKRGLFKPSSAFKQSTTRETAPRSESTKARSWDAISDEFTGVFAQHQQQDKMPQGVEDGNTFGDFQSSNQLPHLGGGSGDFAAFPAGTHPLPPTTCTGQHAQSLPHSQPTGNVTIGPSLQTRPNSDPVSVPSDIPQAGSVMHYGSHMIATSAYQGPLSSTNVLHGMQGQAPNSPQRKSTNSQFSTQSAPVHMGGGPPVGTYRDTTSVQFQAATPNNAPQNLPTMGNTEPVNFTPQTSNFGPPSGSSRPPSSGVDTSRFHPIYHKVFRLCRKPGDEFVSSELLYPVLLSSKLTRVQLRDLWTLANKGRPGKLSQMELFVLLGLVALAQVSKRIQSYDVMSFLLLYIGWEC